MSIFHQNKSFLNLPPVIGPAGTIPQNDMAPGKKTAAKLKKKIASGTDTPIEDTAPAPDAHQLNITTKSKTSIQVITHLTSDTPAPAIMLQTAKGDRHFFGRFGEGLQRAINQNRIKFSHVKNIFISGPVTWESVGGLPGIILTLADQGVSKIALQTAVDNLSWACATWRSFIFRGDLGFNINNAEQNMYYDDFICVKGVSVYPNTLTPEEYHAKSVDRAEIDRKSKDIFDRIFRNQKNNNDGVRKKRLEGTGSDLAAVSTLSLPETEKDPRVSCFIIQIRPTRGKFLPKKAIALGIKPGVEFSKLANGESVTTSEGKVVHPQDVLEPSNINNRVLVIDCPSSEYVENIVTRNDWRQSLQPEREKSAKTAIDIAEGYTEPVSVAYHILGKDVNPFEGKYFEWLTASDSPTFKNDCMHFITHPDYATDGISFDAAALLNMKLRGTFPNNFKRLYTADPAKKFPDPATNGHKIYPMISQGTVSIEPRVMYQSSLEKCGGKVDWEGFEEQLEDTKDVKLQQIDDKVEPHLRNVEVVTLGTGSAIPNKYRNVISTLVNIPGSVPRSVLFDCGEATLGNMRRLYGPEGLNEKIQNIGLLYISHLHADHHLGAISFMNEWLKCTSDQPEKSLYVMGPWKYFDFLEEWSQLESAMDLGRLRFVDNESSIVGYGFMSNPNAAKPTKKQKYWDKELKQDLGLNFIKTCKAIHCELAYCVTFQFNMDQVGETSASQSQQPKTFTVSYSGDTRPTDFFAYRVGSGSDLLIHEATHENGLEKEAYKKRHSTISEAVGIAYKMKAKYTVLTHFSQRYPKLPNMDGLDYDDVDVDTHMCTPESCSHKANSEITGSPIPMDTSPINENGKRSRDRTPEFRQENEGPGSRRNSNSSTKSNDSFGKHYRPPFQIPLGHMPKFALAFDGLHLKMEDIPLQRYKFAELKKMFEEVEKIEAIEDEAEGLQEGQKNEDSSFDELNGKKNKKKKSKP